MGLEVLNDSSVGFKCVLTSSGQIFWIWFYRIKPKNNSLNLFLYIWELASTLTHLCNGISLFTLWCYCTQSLHHLLTASLKHRTATVNLTQLTTPTHYFIYELLKWFFSLCVQKYSYAYVLCCNVEEDKFKFLLWIFFWKYFLECITWTKRD